MVSKYARRLAPLLVVTGALAVAHAAVAADYCVQPQTCAGTQFDSFQKALDAAAITGDADRILLGSGTYTAPTTTGFHYDSSSPVEVIGKGAGGPAETSVTGQVGGSFRVLRLNGGPGTLIRDMRMILPASAAGGTSVLQTNGTARDITVAEDSPQPNYVTGVVLNGGVLEDSVVVLTLGQPNIGVNFDDGGGGVIRGSTVDATTAVQDSYGGLIERSDLSGTQTGVAASRNATTIRSSRIHVDGSGAKAIWATVSADSPQTTVTADGLLIVDDPEPNAVAVEASNSYAPTHSIDVTLDNSIIRLFPKTLMAYGFGGGHVHIAASYSDYTAANAATGTNAAISEANISDFGSAGFDPGPDDPTSPSPLFVDAGDPATPQGLDYLGHALVTDGNHDGIARRDIGPYELPGPLPGEGGTPPSGDSAAPADAPAAAPAATPVVDRTAPLVSGFRTSRSVFAVGATRTPISARVARGTSFRYVLSEDAKVVLTIKRRGGRSAGKLIRSGRGGANSIKFSGRIGKRALKPGRYSAVITATDSAGNRSAARSVRFRVVR